MAAPGWTWLWGRHTVEETLRAGDRRIRELCLLHETKDALFAELVKIARSRGANVRWVKRNELDRISGGASHQGLALSAEERTGEALDGFLDGLSESDKAELILVALDQIQDPHNLGAIARSAACLGARGLLLPDRRTAPVSQAAIQASAGAIERIKVFYVGNLGSALLKLKERGIWIYGAEMSGRPAYEVRFNAPMALVIGSEGAGIRKPVQERCDELVSIPQSKRGVESLNASCAASVLLYEAVRQLRAG